MDFQINGKRVVADVLGSGAPLLLVHGLGGTANSFATIVAAFQASMQVIVPDLPGAGRSDPAPDVSIESLAADLLALLDALGIDSAHVVGHSMGTVVCQHLAALAPTRVRDLVLLGPLAEAPEAARPALRARAETALQDGMAPIAELLCERALAPVTRERQPLVTGFVREMIQRQRPADYAAHCRALAAGVRADPARIRCRSLLIAGHEDTTAPPASVSALAASLPQATHLELADCGHWTALEQPAQVVAAMRTFYAGAAGHQAT